MKRMEEKSEKRNRIEISIRIEIKVLNSVFKTDFESVNQVK